MVTQGRSVARNLVVACDDHAAMSGAESGISIMVVTWVGWEAARRA